MSTENWTKITLKCNEVKKIRHNKVSNFLCFLCHYEKIYCFSLIFSRVKTDNRKFQIFWVNFQQKNCSLISKLYLSLAHYFNVHACSRIYNDVIPSRVSFFNPNIRYYHLLTQYLILLFWVVHLAVFLFS